MFSPSERSTSRPSLERLNRQFWTINPIEIHSNMIVAKIPNSVSQFELIYDRFLQEVHHGNDVPAHFPVQF